MSEKVCIFATSKNQRKRLNGRPEKRPEKFEIVVGK